MVRKFLLAVETFEGGLQRSKSLEKKLIAAENFEGGLLEFEIFRKRFDSG